MTRPALLLFLLVAVPLCAQTRGGPAAPARAPNEGLRQTWTEVSTFLARSAAVVPESAYTYKPVATVRSFGQVITHVAGSQRVFCAAVLGDPAPPDDLATRLRTKADFVQALDESNAYCARAYVLAPARLAETVEFFGRRRSRESVLLMNVTHDYEHYGNVVTYMRLLGLVPPSSQPGS